jgi:antitoxin (DNA-binding transcriptional repressor) of toxin-antitoxin stability system
MKTLAATIARRQWSRLLGRVEHRGQRFAIERNGRLIAAVIPFDETEILAQLEDELDFQQAREAVELARGGERLSWEDVLAYDGMEP